MNYLFLEELSMSQLALYSLGDINQVAAPDTSVKMDLNAPAISVFTDFSVYHPFDLNVKTKAREAIYLMQVAHVRLKFVVDDDKHFLGVVSTQDLNEQEIIRRVAAGQTEDELTVADFMRPKAELMAVSYADLKHATIGAVLQVLREHSCQHCLVVDPEQGHIRGIVSSSDIARQLRIPGDAISAPDFIDVFKVMRPTYLDQLREQVSRSMS
jgi:CBS domain containing-hemolysin-like protein